MLKINNLKINIAKKEVVKGVDLQVSKGEVVALMGPNGSGKSTLAGAIMGNPVYTVFDGEIFFEGENILNLTPDERAKLGIMLAFQYPVAIPGVSVRELLLAALREKYKDTKLSALDLKKQVEIEAEKLNLNPELLTRSINEGFSGGEKKKMEILQMRLLSPKLLILDEIDSGLDIDALEVIAKEIKDTVAERNMSVLVITHYQRLLKSLVPDRVVIMKSGKIIDSGDKFLVEKLEREGYKAYEK